MKETIIDAISGGVTERIKSWLKSQVEKSSTVIKIKEKLKSNYIHPLIYKIINESMVLANEGINLGKKTLELNIKNNQIIIIDWIGWRFNRT